jgi:hypothetical protein
MKSKSLILTTALVLAASLGFHPTQALASQPVSIESLLHEMTDRDAVARFPEPDFRLKEFSSYDRRSKTPADPKGWFGNYDFNIGEKARNFVRIEEKDGRKEWVLMDHQGPGVVVRSWMPFGKVPEGVMIRFYLDGSKTPALEGNACSLLNGSGLIPYPFAHPSLKSAVSYFPIPFAKSCKVTLTATPPAFYYILTFRAYEQGTEVKTFTLEDLHAAQATLKKVGHTLLHPRSSGAQSPVGFTARLGTNEEKSVDLPAGTAAVRELSVKLGSYAEASVTRTTVLKLEFDGKETVWCPVGDFFGTGIGLHPFQEWYRTVAEDGTMTCRWVMPYQTGGKISIVNLGKQLVDVELKAATGAWKWDDRSMFFHANWRGQYPVPTLPRSDWNYITLKGRGVYVGDTLTVMNPAPSDWWGEGDAKVWVDGESFPSLFGTGTEDYYGYSWGGGGTDFYEHPFHAQPCAHIYDKLNPKPVDAPRSTQGYSTETRTRALDGIAFGSSLQFDMEIAHQTKQKCDMGYGVGTYWYGFANTTSNRGANPVELRNVPPLPNKPKN